MKRARDIAPSCSGSQFRARSCLNTRVEMSGLFKPLSLRIAINGRSTSAAALPSFISPRFQWIHQTEKGTLSQIALSARTSVYNLLRAETERRI